nr:transporter substrate-binding domain-containing protein [Aestuariispira insulae]
MAAFLSGLWTTPAQSEPLKGCFVIWEPYTGMRDNEPHGITVDLIKEAAYRAGFDLSLTSLPWKRCLALVQRAEMAFAMDAIDRPGYIHGQHPSALYIQAFWMREGDDYGRFEYIGKLTNKRLGLIQGFQYSTEILNAGFRVIEWLRTEENAAEMLVLDRLDLVYADAVVMQNIISNKGFAVKPLLPVHNVQALYPSFNTSLKSERDRIDNALGSMHEDGTVDAIYRNHTGFDFSKFVELGAQVQAPITTN